MTSTKRQRVNHFLFTRWRFVLVRNRKSGSHFGHISKSRDCASSDGLTEIADDGKIGILTKLSLSK